MTQLTAIQAQALRALVDAVLEAVKAGGSMGAPAGVMYAALMARGCTLSQFQSLMGALVQAGKVTQHGNLYRIAA